MATSNNFIVKNGLTVGTTAIANSQGYWTGNNISVSAGGTGASTATGARTNLGAAASGTNSDISALSSITGNITFTGTSSRFIGDFSNATVLSRTMFQTSGINSTTGIYAIPSGTAQAASWQATNANDPTNASKILIATNGSTDVQLVSGVNGSGTYLPLTFYNSGSEKMRLDPSGRLGLGTTTANVSFAVSNTDAMLVPVGTTAQRPAGYSGLIRYNSSNNSFEGYTTTWGPIGGGAGATGGGTDQVFWENANTITTNYTISSNKNAGTFGPVAINSGVTITVPSGSTWAIL